MGTGTISRQKYLRPTTNIYTLMVRRIGEELRAISQAKMEQQLRERGMLSSITRSPDLQQQNYQKHLDESIEEQKVSDVKIPKKRNKKGVESRILGQKESKNKKHKNEKKQKMPDQKPNEENEDSGSLESHFKEQKKAQRKLQEEKNFERIAINSLNPEDQQGITVRERMLQFKKTYKASNGKKSLLLITAGLILSSMSIILYFLFENYIGTFKYLAEWVPVIYNRYVYMMVGYVFARQRVYMNNTMVSFLETPGYGHNIDMYYNDLSIDVDSVIANLKLIYKSPLTPLMDQMAMLDTPDLCETIITKSSSSLSMYTGSMKKYAVPAVELPEYQSIIETVYLACDSARRGNLEAIRNLVDKYSLNLNYGDYDRCTPLYFAVRGQQLDVVKYLLETAKVDVNKRDRWGGAPIDYTARGSAMEAILIQYGGNRTGIVVNDTSVLPTGVNPLSQDQVRLFYGVYYNNDRAVKNLDSRGINIVTPVDIHGRTTLHIATAEGNLNMVRLLIAYGADINYLDKRGNEPKIDTILGGYQPVYDLINGIQSDTIVKTYCTAFANGVFKKGFQQAKGAFHKKFTDLMLLINSTDNYVRRTTLVYGGRFNSSVVLLPSEIFPAPRAIPDYQQGYELYWHRIMAAVIAKTVSTHNDLKSAFSTQRQLIFFAYMGFLAVVMLFLRKRMIQQMREDIFESRGILNLIPNHFFEQNKPIVEGIMKKLKY
ncbi:hypothetical protein FGO68_gene15699 [Halteria grandinella]|uniref:Ankyrin repeat domain-containing protein n=1 Tax=Halteria grandinella TaxID=5974 RepID=A0A8J8P646_HALGN|nr:hypothetical protein FGO68_gene15699 [Halteria grandinella]